MNNLKCVCPKCKFNYVIPLDKDLTRTLSQNSLYWPVYVGIVADHLGYFPDALHEEYKLMFNPKDSKLVPGAKVGGSTKRMTRQEFSDYLEKIKIWAFNFAGVVLPEVGKDGHV